jgi:predicted PurR-regulated permease PerM
MVDNIIKPYILHGQANLHPLLALLSVIGGVQVLGPIGILVGPMLVAFLQALVNMLNKEIERMELPPALQPAIEPAESSPPEPAPMPHQLP